MRAFNLTQNVVIVANLEVADTALARMKGLLGRSSLSADSGLLITHCNSIHMLFMKFALDVIFLDRFDQVVGLVQNIPPYAVSPIYWRATKAIEVAAGTITLTRTKLGDKLSLV